MGCCGGSWGRGVLEVGWRGWDGWFASGTPIETLLKRSGNVSVRISPSSRVHTLQAHPEGGSRGTGSMGHGDEGDAIYNGEGGDSNDGGGAGDGGEGEASSAAGEYTSMRLIDYAARCLQSQAGQRNRESLSDSPDADLP